MANLLAGLEGKEWLAQPDAAERYAQLVVERFLIGADDGWIFRRALFYRGAIQEEDEREGARNLLIAMAADPYWSGPGYVAWRTGAKLLPHGQDNASIDKIRQVSASLSDRDPGFRQLRAKIHGAPDAGDAERVREYARDNASQDQADAFEELANEIDAFYAAGALDDSLQAFLDREPPRALANRVNGALAGKPQTVLGRLARSGRLLAGLYEGLMDVDDPEWKLAALDLGFVVENDFIAAAAEFRSTAEKMTRAEHVAALKATADAAYGAGLINSRLHKEIAAELAQTTASTVPLDQYRDVLSYLARAPGWATQSMRMHFFASMQKLAELEPIAMRFIQDQLRGSSLLLYADVLDILSIDAGRLAGVRHTLFGDDAGAAFTALNPGLARGVLHAAPSLDEMENFRPDGIYVLPETVSDLPRVRGILTAGEGNPLSHVQLLARNLGIPNATVNESLLPTLGKHDGESVVYAVSPSGLVEIAADGSRWNDVFGEDGDAVAGEMIRPDLEKLDLGVKEFLPLDDLAASDSGRTVGPKAAKLGELRRHYKSSVANGLAIPFGIFKEVALEQPHPNGGTVYDWMVAQYRELGTVDPMDREQAKRYDAFRQELHDLIVNVKLSDEFRSELRSTLESVFGSGRMPGLFVRSDTNVEDLAGFTGAGLNLTLPNVMGIEALIEAIPRVWASPFTARAFAWRQSHMSEPEHVYTSILLLESVASDKSGVMVTQDIDTGDRDTLSVAVNEGLGGAVDGQAAESLRIDRSTGDVRVLATATAPTRRVPKSSGGLEYLRATGSDTVLQPAEIRQLIEFADSLPKKFPPIVDDEGNPAPADIEFGFLGGKLQLFQLRPFLESRNARGSQYLAEMDESLGDTGRITVEMNERPRSIGD
ncbi:MAG: PEP/pyruvate-binding domain-containing protein [Woeseiaceae bacterium]